MSFAQLIECHGSCRDGQPPPAVASSELTFRTQAPTMSIGRTRGHVLLSETTWRLSSLHGRDNKQTNTWQPAVLFISSTQVHSTATVLHTPQKLARGTRGLLMYSLFTRARSSTFTAHPHSLVLWPWRCQRSRYTGCPAPSSADMTCTVHSHGASSTLRRWWGWWGWRLKYVMCGARIVRGSAEARGD